MTDPSRAFGTALRERRQALGLSQGQLAYKARVARSALAAIERFERGCQLATAHALATALGTTIDTMISGEA